MKANDEDIRGRLVAAVGSASHADIARRTGTNRLNVRRYLTLSRIPASFVAAVAKAYGISTEWLLTGKGSTNELDPGSHTTRSITETVLKANTISQQGVVSVLSKKGGRDYLALADSLARYARSQSELAKLCGEELQKITSRGEQQLANGNLALAQATAEAIGGLLPLVTDPAIHMRALEFKAQLGLGTRNYGVAWHDSIRAFALRFATTGGPESGLVPSIAVHARVLSANSRNLEALALMEGVITFSETVTRWDAEKARSGMAALAPVYAQLGWTLLDVGLRRRGIARLSEAMAHLPEDQRDQHRGGLLYALMIGGAVSFEAAISEGVMTTRKLLLFGRYVLMSESVPEIQCWLRHAKKFPHKLAHPLVPICIKRVEALLGACQGKGCNHDEWQRVTDADPNSKEFIDAVHGAQHQLASGKRAAARELSELAESLIRPTHRLCVELAIHYRTRLKLDMRSRDARRTRSGAEALRCEAYDEGNMAIVRALQAGFDGS